MTQVVVQLSPNALSGPESAKRQAPFERANDFGLTLKALHPESDDPVLSCWFSAEVDSAKATEFIESLRKMPEVTAAYVKPRAEPP